MMPMGAPRTKALLYNTRTKGILTFQYNPGEVEHTTEAKWAEITIPGLSSPLHQFIAGGADEIPLELMFTEFGHNKRTNPLLIGTVEDAIAFLIDSKTPRKMQVGDFSVTVSPDLMVLFWGRVKFDGVKAGFECFIRDLTIRRILHKAGTLEADRVEVKLSLVKFNTQGL